MMQAEPIKHSLQGVTVRVHAEFGRTRVQLTEALELAPGALLDLDETTDEPIRLYVNGRCFATGRLVDSPAGGWALCIDELVGS